MRFLKVCTILSILLFLGCNKQYMVINKTIDREELLFLHNLERTKLSKKNLKIDLNLEKNAQKWAESMAYRNRLKHSTLQGINYDNSGENIAMGQSTEQEVMEDWIESKGHYKNIIFDKFTHVGFGFAQMQNGRIYWCVQFGGNNKGE